MIMLATAPSVAQIALPTLRDSVPSDSIQRAPRTISNSQPSSCVDFLTPNSYELTRYGRDAVDLSHGIPQISIPLASVSDRDISVDVALSYLASGIKVDQEASTVGLGWSLFAGGVISRSVRGRPDDFLYDGTFRQRTDLRFYDSYSYSSLNSYISQEADQIRTCADPNPSTDPAPDIFSFNFCGRSGSFYLDDDATGQLHVYSDMKVSYIRIPSGYSTDGYFVITDENGVKYTFDATENAYLSSAFGYVPVSWYLTSITSPTGASIQFTYIQDADYEKTMRHYDKCYIPLYENIYSYQIGTQYTAGSVRTEHSVSPLLISRIQASSGARIDFTYTAGARQDMKNYGRTLTGIRAYNGRGDTIKRYTLGYGYFQADSQHRTSLQGYGYLNYRLKLTSVREYSADGTSSLPPYTFTYYGDDGNGNHILPYRLSPCQDHFGYYNGTHNTSMFPGISHSTTIHIDPWIDILRSNYMYNSSVSARYSYRYGYYSVFGADRSINPSTLVAGTLKEIRYPTGGLTRFSFESNCNEVTNEHNLGIGGIRVSEIVDLDGTVVKRRRTFSYTAPQMGYQSLENRYHTVFYQYVDPQNGRGVHADLFCAYGIPPQYMNSYGVIEIGSNPVGQFGIGDDFMYKYVTETTEGVGRTEYEFSYQNDAYSSGDGVTCDNLFRSQWLYMDNGPLGPVYFEYDYDRNNMFFPFLTKSDMSWKRGNLVSRTVYDDDGSLLQRDRYIYNTGTIKAKAGYKAASIDYYTYIYACDYLFSGLSRLASETHEYRGGVTKTVRYAYDSQYRTKVTERTENSSDGSETVTRSYYASSYGSTFSHMMDKNIIKPIDVRTYRNGMLAEGVQVRYNVRGQDSIRHIFDNVPAAIPFMSYAPYTFTASVWYTYDLGGSLISEKFLEGNTEYVYIWSYGRQYPVARVANPTVSSRISLFTMNSSFTTKATLTTSDWQQLRQLQTGTSQVSIYDYKPGVGMTKEIGPRGSGYEYEYDGFQRLSKRYIIDNGTRYLDEQYQINIVQQ